MTEQLVTKVNESQAKWKQMENATLIAKTEYLRNVEASYDALKEFCQSQTELLVALLAPRPQQEPVTVTPSTARVDNVPE